MFSPTTAGTAQTTPPLRPPPDQPPPPRTAQRAGAQPYWARQDQARRPPPAPTDKLTALLRALDSEAATLEGQAYADNTKKSVATAQRSYERFCQLTGLWPDPATGAATLDIKRYIALMTRTLKYKTILNYLTMGVRTFHSEHGIPYAPPHDNAEIKTLLKGTRRTLGDAQKQKLPITIDLLEQIYDQLDFSRLTHVSIWAAFTLAFFCLLRKSQITGTSKDGAWKDTHLLQLTDIDIDKEGRMWITLTHTKTIQFRERRLRLPIANILVRAYVRPRH